MKSQGFSLLEILIYVTFVSVIAFVFVTFSLDVLGTAQKARVRQEVQDNLRFSMQRITQEIREANGLNVGGSAFGSHPGLLSLSMDSGAENPTVFDVSGGVLRITQGAGAAQPLTDPNLTVSNLVFTNLSVTDRTTNIGINLTIEHPNPENIELFDVQLNLRSSATVREDEDQ